MKRILFMASLIASVNVFGAQICNSSLETEYYSDHFGQGLEMRIYDQDAIHQIEQILPYADCYNGVCTSYYSKKREAYIIRFDQKLSNGYRGLGKAATYITKGIGYSLALAIDTGVDYLVFDFISCE